MAELIRQLPSNAGGSGLYSLSFSSTVGFAYSWNLARNNIGFGFWRGIDMARNKALSTVFSDSTSEHFTILVPQK